MRSRWAIRNSQRIKEYTDDYLHKHPCVDCGETDIRLLQFDHRDPSEKKFNVRNYDRRIDAVIEEIAKCDIRCIPCHKKRSQAERHHQIRPKPKKKERPPVPAWFHATRAEDECEDDDDDR